MRSHVSQMCQISDVWRQEAELLRNSGDGVDLGDVYDGLRLRTCDDGFDMSDRIFGDEVDVGDHISDDGVNLGDVYDGLRLRTSGDGFDMGDRFRDGVDVGDRSGLFLKCLS
jgi:hypothetical protein